MPKLVYVYGDDNKMLDTLVTSLRSNGYSIEYTNLTDEVSTGNITADIALICKPVSPTTKFAMGGLTIDLDNMAAYITDNLDRIRHTPVRCELTEDIPDIYSEAKELVVQIPSERVDVLVSKVYHLSRNDVTSLIKGKKIYIDGVLCNKDGARIKNGNVISVRGYGRIWYGEVMQTTKKGNLCVKVSAAV